MMYVDMDGVLCDFAGQLKNRYNVEIVPAEPMQDMELLEKLNNDYSFWRYMPLTPYAKTIIDVLGKNELDYVIVSKAKTTSALAAKMEWIDKVLREIVPPYGSRFSGVCLFKHDHRTKHDFLKPSESDFLIDDMIHETLKWRYSFFVDCNFSAEALEVFVKYAKSFEKQEAV